MDERTAISGGFRTRIRARREASPIAQRVIGKIFIEATVPNLPTRGPSMACACGHRRRPHVTVKRTSRQHELARMLDASDVRTLRKFPHLPREAKHLIKACKKVIKHIEALHQARERAQKADGIQAHREGLQQGARARGALARAG